MCATPPIDIGFKVCPGDTIEFVSKPWGHWLVRALTSKGDLAVATSTDNPLRPGAIDTAILSLEANIHYIPVGRWATTAGGHDEAVDAMVAELDKGLFGGTYQIRAFEIATINGKVV